jgi:hypothetical protein
VYTGALRDSLRTDLSREELIQVAGLGASLRGEQVERYALDQHGIVILDAPATFAADPQTIQALVGALLGGEAGDKRQETGDIRQGTGARRQETNVHPSRLILANDQSPISHLSSLISNLAIIGETY